MEGLRQKVAAASKNGKKRADEDRGRLDDSRARPGAASRGRPAARGRKA